MNKQEALEICQRWLDYLTRQREKSVRIQKLAMLARTQPEEAKKQLKQLDNSVRVYDASQLEPAVKFLMNAVKDKS